VKYVKRFTIYNNLIPLQQNYFHKNAYDIMKRYL